MIETEIEQNCQEFMQDMKKEIDVLQQQLNHVKLENFKRNCRRSQEAGRETTCPPRRGGTALGRGTKGAAENMYGRRKKT